jgi:hypothetical protein
LYPFPLANAKVILLFRGTTLKSFFLKEDLTAKLVSGAWDLTMSLRDQESELERRPNSKEGQSSPSQDELLDGDQAEKSSEQGSDSNGDGNHGCSTFPLVCYQG